jgi:hypothetical protein
LTFHLLSVRAAGASIALFHRGGDEMNMIAGDGFMPSSKDSRNDNSRVTGSAAVEVWGGVEGSMVYVRDVLRDQFRETGHYDRLSDIAAIADMGIRKLRYTAAWERIAPNDPLEQDWAWQDERMAELQRQGISPILGLVHPRQRADLHLPLGLGLSREAGAVRRRGGPALPLGAGLDPGERAGDHGPLLRPLRPVEPARGERAGLPAHARHRVSRGDAGDARHPRGDPRRAAGADRGSGPQLLHGAAARAWRGTTTGAAGSASTC